MSTNSVAAATPVAVAVAVAVAKVCLCSFSVSLAPVIVALVCLQILLRWLGYSLMIIFALAGQYILPEVGFSCAAHTMPS